MVLASSGILRSRGDNFLFKNVEIVEIRQKFAEIGRFECGISSEDPISTDLTDFLYISFTDVKGNQENQLNLDPRRKFRTQIDLSQRIFNGFKKFQHF